MVKSGIGSPLSSASFSSFEENNLHNVIKSSSHQNSPPLKKIRGRPLGSKNKPKLPLKINIDNDLPLKPFFIQVPKYSDVIGAVIQFARQYQVSVKVESASGCILNATLCHTLSDTSPFIVHGPFTLISLAGTYVNNNHYTASSSLSLSSNLDLRGSFRISFCRDSGQSFTGVVGGKVIAVDDVIVVATILKEL